MNFLSFTWMHYEFTIFFVNLLWIYSFFREFIMLPFSVYRGFSRNSLSWVLLLMYSDFTWRRIWREKKGNKLSYLSTLSLYIKNRTQLSVTRIHYVFIYGFANQLAISRKYQKLIISLTINSLTVSWIHYVFIIYIANSLWIYYLFREVTKNSLCFANSLWIHYFISRIDYF